MKLLLKNGFITDSVSRTQGNYDILITDNVISEVAEHIEAEADEIIDCTGLAVIPGLCDMHVHFRDPGQTHKEDIFTGAEAAAAAWGVKLWRSRTTSSAQFSEIPSLCSRS